MLVFSARQGETIDIGDEIRVRVIATEAGRVRLGVETPAELESRVTRDEQAAASRESHEPGD